ncbi:unnamed protein product [Rhizopus microsporus]
MTSRESSPVRKEEKKEQQQDVTEEKNIDELIDMSTFDQLLEMDDEDDHEFSQGIVVNYFDQANETFKDMDRALKKEDLSELSRLGHFLKGSSAAIGLKKVQASCEKIQNYGNRKGEDDTLTEEEALKRIADLLPQVKKEYSEAEEYLKKFYEIQDPL